MTHQPPNSSQTLQLLTASGRVISFAGILLTEIRSRGWTADQPTADAAGRAAVNDIVILSDMTHNLSTIGAQIALLAANDPTCNIERLQHECNRMVRVIRSKDHDRLFTSGTKWAGLVDPIKDILAVLCDLDKPQPLQD
jgi:hypothetical protein